MRRHLVGHAIALALASVAAESYRADATPATVRPAAPVKAPKPKTFAEQRLRDRARKLEKRTRR